MNIDPYDMLLVLAAVAFGVASAFIGWSVLRDRGRPTEGEAGGTTDTEHRRPHVGLELLAWAIPTILMVALFAAAIGTDR